MKQTGSMRTDYPSVLASTHFTLKNLQSLTSGCECRTDFQFLPDRRPQDLVDAELSELLTCFKFSFLPVCQGGWLEKYLIFHLHVEEFLTSTHLAMATHIGTMSWYHVSSYKACSCSTIVAHAALRKIVSTQLELWSSLSIPEGRCLRWTHSY